jgi:hypothetical protein
VFQPTYLALLPYSQSLPVDDGALPQPNILNENYIEDAYSVVDDVPFLVAEQCTRIRLLQGC